MTLIVYSLISPLVVVANNLLGSDGGSRGLEGLSSIFQICFLVSDESVFNKGGHFLQFSWICRWSPG